MFVAYSIEKGTTHCSNIDQSSKFFISPCNLLLFDILCQVHVHTCTRSQRFIENMIWHPVSGMIMVKKLYCYIYCLFYHNSTIADFKILDINLCKIIQNVACFYFQVSWFTWIHTTAVSESSETHTSWLWGQETETCAKGLFYVWWSCSQIFYAISNSIGLRDNTFGIDNFFSNIDFYELHPKWEFRMTY